jgi:hypothetical protein
MSNKDTCTTGHAPYCGRKKLHTPYCVYNADSCTLFLQPDPLSRLLRVRRAIRGGVIAAPLPSRQRALKIALWANHPNGWFAAHLSQKTTGRYQESDRFYRWSEDENAAGNPGNGTVFDPSTRLRPGHWGAHASAFFLLTVGFHQALRAILSNPHSGVLPQGKASA